MPLLCAIAIVRPEMKVIRGDSSVLLPRSSLQSAQASKNYNLILFRTILNPPDSFVSKNEGMAEVRECSQWAAGMKHHGLNGLLVLWHCFRDECLLDKLREVDFYKAGADDSE